MDDGSAILTLNSALIYMVKEFVSRCSDAMIGSY